MTTCRSRLLTVFLAVVFTVTYVAYFHDRLAWRGYFSQPLNVPKKPGVEIVVASMAEEDTTWLAEYLPEWKTNIYVVNDARARLTVPMNKGRESMVYLTYMIDHYDDLPESVLFIHASRFAWHNDDPDYDAVTSLLRFQLPYLRQAGYVNMRCAWQVGCPAEIRPHEDDAKDDGVQVSAKSIYKKKFQELLPELPVPAVVAVSCCSQFGVTRETIRRRPKEDYIRYRQWLIDTKLEDALSGRMLEFSWHSKLPIMPVRLHDSPILTISQ